MQHCIFFTNFTAMNAVRYYSIGSHASNNLKLDATISAPFHLMLHKDQTGQVLVTTRMPQTSFHLNGAPRNEMVVLQPGDELSIGAQQINWMQIFSITAEEIIYQQTTEENNQTERKGMRIQLVLIYLAIVVLLFLMAFYI
jgi:hypothetical protein